MSTFPIFIRTLAIWLSDFTFTFHFHALEKEMATHCSVLAWRIPGTGEPGGLPLMGSHRVGHDWSDLAVAAVAVILASGHGIQSHHFMANRWGNDGNNDRLYFLGLQNHCRWWLQLWNSKMHTPWKKSFDQPRQNMKKQRHYFPTKVYLVKAMVIPGVIYGCESWTVEKADCRRIDAFELWCWRRLLRVLWTARRSNESILKEISPEYSLEGLMLELKL